MILKKFKYTNLTRTRRAMIGGLFDYVLAEKDEGGKDKCVWSSPEFYRRHKEGAEGGIDFTGRGVRQELDACGPLDDELERE